MLLFCAAQSITFMNASHYHLSKVKSAFPGILTNDKFYHMILVIIINERDEIMLQRALGSGWGVLFPAVAIIVLGFAGLSVDAWRGMIVAGLLLTALMIWHRQLRHYVLLPSCVALISGMVLMMMNLKLMG
jgi:hypothetical protein